MPEEHVEALLENVHGLVGVLHEVYTVARDYADDELRHEPTEVILERARTVLKEHGVEV